MNAERRSLQEARDALSALETFLAEQRAAAGGGANAPPLHEREPYFLALARRATAGSVPAALDELLEEFRGTGHYFASYAPDQQGVSDHLERLFLAVEAVRAEAESGRDREPAT